MAFRIIIDGRVQGVGCRYYILRYGKAFGISGSASNLADGTVSILLGTDDHAQVVDFTEAIRENRHHVPFAGLITSTMIEPYSGSLSGDYDF